MLIRLGRCCGWSVCNKIRFSHVKVQNQVFSHQGPNNKIVEFGWLIKLFKQQESTLPIISMIYISFQTTPPSSPSSLGSRKSSMCSISSITSSSSGSTQSHSPSHNKNLPQVRSHSPYYEQLLIYSLITQNSNLFLASCDFCCLMITFASSLDPHQDRQTQHLVRVCTVFYTLY